MLLLAAVALAGISAVALIGGRGADGGLDRSRVAVAVFSNRTGDSTLEPLGNMAADWVTRGLIHTAMVEVVDVGALYVQGRSPAGEPTDPIALASRNGAGTVVSGNYYLADDSLVVRASVVDVATGTVLQTVSPVRVQSAAAVQALELLQQRVMAAIAGALDVRYSSFTSRPSAPPDFSAYQYFVAGQTAYWQGRPAAEARALFQSAASEDSTFLTAAAWLAFVGANGAGCRLTDSVSSAMAGKRGELAPFDRLTLEISAARCRNDWLEGYRLAVEQAGLRPRSSYAAYTAGFFGLTSGHFREARKILLSIEPQRDLGWLSDSAKTNYWRDLTGAEHLLGEYEEELRHAEPLVQSFPDRLAPRLLVARALAALGRSSDALAHLDASLRLPDDQAVRVQGGLSPGSVCYLIAIELAHHGDSTAGRAAAQRSVNWYQERSGDRLAARYERHYLARALTILGRLDEAVAVLAFRSAATDSTDPLYLGLRGVLAAKQGRAEEAKTLEAQLARLSVPGAPSLIESQRARIVLALGDRERALELLETAFAKGLSRAATAADMHSDPFLDPLRGEARFEAVNRGR